MSEHKCSNFLSPEQAYLSDFGEPNIAEMANLPKACAQCKTDQNLYHSPKYCTNRIRTWEEEPHVFCLRCLLRHSSYFNNYESYWGYVAKIACPCCRSALFEITHWATGRVRPIDDLLMELHVYDHCCKSACAQLALVRVTGSIARRAQLLSLSLAFEKSNYRELELLMVVKRLFLRKPHTYAEYENSVDYEMAWYDWGPFPKCEHCRTEHNIYQCVNKSECKHIFCLRCLLLPVYDARVDNVFCPVCNSYCAGTAEEYHTKAVLPLNVTKMLYMAVKASWDIEEAHAYYTNHMDYYELSHRRFALQATERLLSQPECYKAFKNLRVVDLPTYEYKEVLNEHESEHEAVGI